MMYAAIFPSGNPTEGDIVSLRLSIHGVTETALSVGRVSIPEIRLEGVEKRIQSTTRAISLCVRLDSGILLVAFCPATSLLI
jgi:hypothetical protein